MSKNLKILINYSLYFILFFIICIIGASNVFAVSINESNYATKYYWYTADNSSSTTSTDYRTGSDNKVTLYGATSPTYTNGEGFNGFYNRINYSISKGSIYTLSLSISFSSLQESEFGTSNINNRLLNTDFAHCSNCTITAVSGNIRKYNSTNQSVSGLYDYVVQMSYTFVATSNANTWYIGSYTGDDRTLGIDNHLYTSNVMVNNLEISNDNSSTIINQNDTIINQNQQMIDQNQQNTENIIDNNNTNTDKIIEENKKNFNDCRDSVNLFDSSLNEQTINGVNIKHNEDGTITLNGTATSSYTGYIFTNYPSGVDFINIPANTTYTAILFVISGTFTYDNTITSNSSIQFWQPWNRSFQLFFRNVSNNKLIVSKSWNEDVSLSRIQLAFTENDVFNNYTIGIQFEKGSSTTWEQFGEEICVNKLDEQKNAINNLDDTLKNDNVDDNGIADAYEDFNDYLDDNSTITQLITLPITLYTAILNNLNGSCSPFNLGKLYGEDLILPCINISQYLGNSLWSMIDIIISGFAIYAISKKMIKVFNNFSSLREGDVIDD